MDKNSSTKKEFQKLRKKAESKLLKGKEQVFNFSQKEIEHELSVHKIELEMQNDELLNAQSLLLESVEEYVNLFDFAPIGYFILDQNGKIVNVNKMGSTLLNVPQVKLIGKHFSTFLYTTVAQDSFYIQRQKVIESGKQQRGEFEIIRKNGEIIDSIIETSIMKDLNGQFKYLFTVINDVTLQKAQERKLALALMKERELNDMKSQFITIASHEFRTPLATILSSAELIENYSDKLDTMKRSQHFHKIKTSINRLKEILIDFHSANEIENGGTINRPDSFDIKEYIPHLLNELTTFNGIHSIGYKHTGNTTKVTLDKKLLKTCLSNLIINAFKFSPNGGKIDIFTQLTKSGEFTFSIRDRGIGIPKADQAHIFQSFFRAQNAMNIQGTGLGLHITQKLIQIMGGQISCKSEENKGTTFFLKFHTS